MYKKLIIPCILLVIVFNGCEYSSEEELYGLEECEVENVTFSEKIEPLIVGTCAVEGCHVPGNGRFLLRNYEEIKENVDNGSVGRHAIELRDMPPSGPLSRCQIEELAAWIDAGAPNN